MENSAPLQFSIFILYLASFHQNLLNLIFNPPHTLIIGHVCHDVILGGYAPGGAAYYAGLLAHRLSYQSAILTSFGEDFQFASQFGGIDLHVVPSPETTVFENIYHPDGQRIQYLPWPCCTARTQQLAQALACAKDRTPRPHLRRGQL